MMPNKKTAGRQKIEMKKIEKKSSRQVTFSKRRGGLFRKAAELCVLTGAEVAIIAQSPGNHVYAFGHRDVDSLIQRYLENNVSLSENPSCMHGEVYNKYLKIANELEVEKNKLKNVVEENINGCWWEDSFEDLEMDQLQNFINKLEELKNNVVNRANELRNSATSSSLINTDGSDHELMRNSVMSSSLINTDGSDHELMRNSVMSSSLINTNGSNELRTSVMSSLLINMNGSDELSNSGVSSSLINTNGADELRNLVTSSPFDTTTNLSNAEGLLDDQVNQLPDVDQFLPNNVGVTNENLLTLLDFNYNSGVLNNNSLGNRELALTNQDYVNHVQVSSDFSTPGVPNDNNFGQGQS
ncbi:uncharacterized protein LOC141665368 [Apium graveolens]|uniref:uncharacterized protein LOC141665368 n=1 Tax=Apium graveolens TaxID=4045 RepID=UPI003D78BEC2